MTRRRSENPYLHPILIGIFLCLSIGSFMLVSKLQGSTYTPDDMLVVTGFTVEIDNAGTGCTSQVPHGGTCDILENGAGKFTIDIEGCPVASANVQSVNVDDLIIKQREMTTGADWDYRVYGPGDVIPGKVYISSRVGHNSKELYQWWLDCSQGKNIRKNITLTALNRDGSDARSWTFFEAFPVRWNPGNYSPDSQVVTESIIVIPQRVEFGSGSESCTDSSWESLYGGGLNIEVASSSTGSDPYHTTTPGHKCVRKLELEGPMTSCRQEISQWLNDTITGNPWKRTVVIQEILKDGSPGKTFTYLDCFPRRYVFPQFDASGTGNLYEKIVIRPIRLELARHLEGILPRLSEKMISKQISLVKPLS